MERDKIFDFATVMLVAAWAILLPIQGLILALGTLVMADLITGIWKSVKRRKKITSRGFRSTIGKIAIYFTVLVAGFSLDYIASNDTPIIARVVSVAIALTEIKSIFENFYAITGIDLVKATLAKFKTEEKSEEEAAFDEPEPKDPHKKKKRSLKKKH